MAGLLLEIEKMDQPRGFRLVGELDVSNAKHLAAALLPEVEAGGDLTLDIAGLIFMDSTGIQVLLTAAQEMEGRGRLVLQSPGSLVRRTLELLGASRMPNLDLVD